MKKLLVLFPVLLLALGALLFFPGHTFAASCSGIVKCAYNLGKSGCLWNNGWYTRGCGSPPQCPGNACDRAWCEIGTTCRCDPGATTCGNCSKTCGGGISLCTDGCSWWNVACNTQACPPSCTPGATVCGDCSVLCGGGTKACTDGCSWWNVACNTQACIIPTPAPSCTVDLLPATSTTSVGSSVTLTASVTIGSGSVSSVGFTSSNTAVATVNPASDTTPTYSTSVSALSAGSSTITANVYMGAGIVCSDTAAQTVTAIADPWWQVQDSDVSTNGDLVSEIPATCTLPGCNPVFNLKGTGTFPGVTLYGGGNADFAAGSGQGKAAEDPNNWLVASSYQGKTYDYAYFARQIPSDVSFTEVTDTTVNGGFFQSGGVPSRGYVWYHYNGNILGDLTMQGNLNLNGTRKVVLLIEGSDFHLDSGINIQRTGEGFFMVVVGKNTNGLKGNIFVDPSVSGSPSIEGLFLAEGTFHSGAGSSQLHVLGSVVGYDGIALERDLGQPANNTAPAEFFEYSPELMSVFPQVFTTRRMRWKEVAP